MSNKNTPVITKQLRKTIAEEFNGEGAKQIEVVDAGEYSRANMIIYGMNIVVMRYFPRIEDGLNPCRLRLLWTMFNDHHLSPDGRFVKTPEFIGHVSKYHPHGEIKETFDCMARSWENNAPLVTVRGNTGSQSGEGAAAMRYLDSKLSVYAWKCFFEEFDEDITDMRDNYIRSDKEPVFLPAKYPNFLLNNLTGISWGFADSFPQFNLTEAFRLTQALIRNPEMTNVHLFPDCERGYLVIDNGTAQKVCDNGYGVFPCEAKVEYMEEEHSLSITGFPHKIKYDDVINKIALLIKDKKISGIDNIADTSSFKLPCVVVELKKGANPYQVIDELFSANVGLRSSVEMRYYFAERTHMMEYGLKGAILEWIDRRIVSKQKYYVKKIGTLQKRRHELEGLIPIIKDKTKFHQVVDVILSGENEEDIERTLCKEFQLSSYQASRLIDKKLRDSSKRRIGQLEEEMVKLDEKIIHVREAISSKETIKEVIYKELEEGIKLFGKPRMCPIVKEGEQRQRPELFYRMVITKKYAKKLSIGGKQVGLVSSEDDIVGYYPQVSEHDMLLVVNDLGKVYQVPVKKLPSHDISSKGTDLVSAVGLKGTAIRSILINKHMIEQKENVLVGMFTQKGIVKTSPLSQYITNKTEIQGILLNQGDKVCWAHVYDKTEENKQQLIYTVNGLGISFHIDAISTQDRLTKGLQYLKLQDDIVSGVVQVALGDYVFVLTCKGYGKLCKIADIFEASKRKKDMIRITSLHDGDQLIRVIPITSSDCKLTVYLQSGEKREFMIDDIDKMTRLAKGKKLVPVRQGDAIYRVKLE